MPEKPALHFSFTRSGLCFRDILLVVGEVHWRPARLDGERQGRWFLQVIVQVRENRFLPQESGLRRKAVSESMADTKLPEGKGLDDWLHRRVKEKHVNRGVQRASGGGEWRQV